MRAFQAFALAAALALPVALPARAAEAPLTRDGLLGVLKSNKVWCSSWRAKDQSCEDIAFVEAKGDEVKQISRYRISDQPDLQMVVRETVKVEGAALCSTFHFNALDIVVLMDGEPAETEQTLPLLAILAQSMADLEGKKSCEVFVRDDATGELKGTVTLDGEAAPEFDSIYQLIAPETRIQLRPVFEDAEAVTTT
ncbi:MAG: hypothetical protein V4466_08580 [Pseudomonadota bacterium]